MLHSTVTSDRNMAEGVTGKLCCVVYNIMVRWDGTVTVDNQYTSTFPITNGVRQGDALSSVLFDLVLEAITRKLNITGHIGTPMMWQY